MPWGDYDQRQWDRMKRDIYEEHNRNRWRYREPRLGEGPGEPFSYNIFNRDFWRVNTVFGFWPLDFVVNVFIKSLTTVMLYGMAAFFIWIFWGFLQIMA